jgi:hypothetical protein
MLAVRRKSVITKVVNKCRSKWFEKRLLAWRVCQRIGDPLLAQQTYRTAFPQSKPKSISEIRELNLSVLRDMVELVKELLTVKAGFGWTATAINATRNYVTALATCDGDDDITEDEIEERVNHDIERMVLRADFYGHQ